MTCASKTAICAITTTSSGPEEALIPRCDNCARLCVCCLCPVVTQAGHTVCVVYIFTSTDARAGPGEAIHSKQSNDIPSISAGVPSKPQSRGPAASRKATTAKPSLQSSPLYAASEGEDSECESSAHDSEPARSKLARPTSASRQQPQPKVHRPPLPKTRHRSTKDDSMLAERPPNGKAKQTAATSTIARPQSRQGSKARSGADGTTDGFELMSQEDEQQPLQVKAKQASKTSKITKPQSKPHDRLRLTKQVSKADGQARVPKDDTQQLQQGMARQQSKAQAKPADNPDDDMMVEDEEEQHQPVAAETLGQQSPASHPSQKLLPQIAAVRHVEAAHGSAQDPEWLAIAEKVLDAQDLQLDDADASLASPAAHRSPAPKHRHYPQHKHTSPITTRQEEPPQEHSLQLQPQDILHDEHEAAAPTTSQQARVRDHKQTKQDKVAKPRSRPPAEKQAQPEEEEEDLPATYNNMPLRHKADHEQMLPQPEGNDSQNSHPSSSGPAQQERQDHVNSKKRQPSKEAGSALDYMADSESESDDYVPTQARAAAARAASKAANKKAAAVKPEPKGKAKQPKPEKVHLYMPDRLHVLPSACSPDSWVTRECPARNTDWQVAHMYDKSGCAGPRNLTKALHVTSSSVTVDSHDIYSYNDNPMFRRPRLRSLQRLPRALWKMARLSAPEAGPGRRHRSNRHLSGSQQARGKHLLLLLRARQTVRAKLIPLLQGQSSGSEKLTKPFCWQSITRRSCHRWMPILLAGSAEWLLHPHIIDWIGQNESADQKFVSANLKMQS